MKHRSLAITGLVALTTIGVGAFYSRGGDAAPNILAEPITRGSVVSIVAATGTLEAVTTVQVGTQVSGTIQTLMADYNSIVGKGQVLARLDPSLFESAIEQARANLIRAEADRDRLQVALADAVVKLARARELSARQLIPASELDAAEVNRRSAEAQVKSAAAQVTQARAALSQAQVNLSKTVITSPIDGIVIARNVDVGQTVAASLQAPTLFEIAADLSRMQLKANIDEADLGRIAEGQPVSFSVDAYPGDTFTGRVEQVRLNPVIEQNVVTYAAIVSAPNRNLKLKPGMTASLTVEVARRDDVLRVPNAALRFRPSGDVLAALGAAPVPHGFSAADRESGTIWQRTEAGVQPVRIGTGVSDGTYTEVIGGTLGEGAQVVTRVTLAGSTAAQPGSARSPLLQTGPGPRR
jgi:HlyD family secretion protein